jgi:hypothetical protein
MGRPGNISVTRRLIDIGLWVFGGGFLATSFLTPIAAAIPALSWHAWFLFTSLMGPLITGHIMAALILVKGSLYPSWDPFRFR